MYTLSCYPLSAPPSKTEGCVNGKLVWLKVHLLLRHYHCTAIGTTHKHCSADAMAGHSSSLLCAWLSVNTVPVYTHRYMSAAWMPKEQHHSCTQKNVLL